MTNTQSEFKKRNPHYFKNYYQQNKAKFQARNRSRPSNRKFYYVLSIDNKQFCFKHKSDIKINKMNIADIDKNNVIFSD